MLRSGFLLGVVGPAAFLTALVLPSVRASADREVFSAAVEAVDFTPPVLSYDVPNFLRPVSFEISPVHDRPTIYATMPRPATPSPSAVTGPASRESELPKPRRLTREGCETPLSSLVGPEARRMVPGRCMA